MKMMGAAAWFILLWFGLCSTARDAGNGNF